MVTDMDNVKRNIKNNISTLVEKGNLQNAVDLIGQYEKIVADDVDIYSMRAVMAMMEGDMDRAEIILKKGLEIDEGHFDTLYNLGYLYQSTMKNVLAIEYYKRALQNAKNGNGMNEVCTILKGLGVRADGNESQGQNLMPPKVTIVIPTYNQKKYLMQAIESCLEQDYPSLEIIVGDDCSIDGTEVMMKKYKKNKQIKYIRNKKNLGAGKNSPYLLFNHVNSKYAMILNHDDYLIRKDYISTATDLLVRNPNVSFVWANCKIKNEISRQESFTKFKISKVTKGIDYFLNYETDKFPHITGRLTTVFDFEKLKLTQYGSEKTKGKDTFMYLRLMLVGDVGFVNECVSVYRVHEGGISLNMPIEFDESTIKEFEKLKNFVLEEEIASKKEMKDWINNRVCSYVSWRFSTLWNNKKRKEALNLLVNTSKQYPIAYKKLLDRI